MRLRELEQIYSYILRSDHYFCKSKELITQLILDIKCVCSFSMGFRLVGF